MKPYKRVGWIDHIVDVLTGTVVQEGTPLSQSNLNRMDNGIANVTQAVIELEERIDEARPQTIVSETEPEGWTASQAWLQPIRRKVVAEPEAICVTLEATAFDPSADYAVVVNGDIKSVQDLGNDGLNIQIL